MKTSSVNPTLSRSSTRVPFALTMATPVRLSPCSKVVAPAIRPMNVLSMPVQPARSMMRKLRPAWSISSTKSRRQRQLFIEPRPWTRTNTARLPMATSYVPSCALLTADHPHIADFGLRNADCPSGLSLRVEDRAVSEVERRIPHLPCRIGRFRNPPPRQPADKNRPR